MEKGKIQSQPGKKSTKHSEIDKNQAIIFAILAVASFIVVFSGFTLRALFAQQQYQSAVITEKEQALEEIEDSLASAEGLQRAYTAFISQPENIIGGFSEGEGEQAGDSARIVLDALPSQYDFPAFITSVEQILLRQQITIDTISGADEELELRDIESDEPIQIPLSVGFTGNYEAIQNTVAALEASIRPFSFQTIGLQGDDENLRVEMRGHSYFQPGKEFRVGSRVVQP